MKSINSSRASLSSVLSGWIESARPDTGLRAFALLGPEPVVEEAPRRVYAVHPPSAASAARALADSDEYGAAWRADDGPLFAYQTLRAEVGTWSNAWIMAGARALVRVAMPLPGDRELEMYLFTDRELTGNIEASVLAWQAMGMWPQIRRCIREGIGLNERERMAVHHAFAGKTARESAEVMGCKERTVVYYLQQATDKMQIPKQKKGITVKGACWLGVI